MSLAVVQAQAVGSIGSVRPGVTFLAGPTSGNLLIATLMIEDFDYVLDAAAGWQVAQIYASGVSSLLEVVFFKYCGASESTTQSPITTVGVDGWAITIWEISGVSGVLSQDFAEVYSSLPTDFPGTSATPTSFTNIVANELVLLGNENGNAGVVTVSISGGGTWSADAGPGFGTNQGYNQTAYGWSQFFSASGNTVNPTLTSSGGNRFFVNYVGLTTSASTGSPQLVQRAVQGLLGASAIAATFPVAPTSGNLLIAFCYSARSGGAPTANTGWTIDTTSHQTTGGFDNDMTVFYKYAGAGESATQSPDATTGRSAWDVIIWEVSGVTGVWANDHVATTLAVNTASGSLGLTATTSVANELGLVGYLSGASSTAAISSTLPAQHAAYFQSGGGGYAHASGGWHVLAPSASTAISPTFSNGGGAAPNQCWACIVELQKASGATGQGDIGTITFTAPTASVPATGQGNIGTITFTAPTASVPATGQGNIGTITFSPIQGVANVTGQGSLGTITFSPPRFQQMRMTQYTLQTLSMASSFAHMTQFTLGALGKNTVNARVTSMALLVLAKGGEPPLRPNPLSLHDAGREPVLRQRFINMYPEQTPQGPGQDARYQRGGLYSAAQRGGGPLQALQHWVGPDPGTEQFLMSVSGGSVYRDDVNIGTIDPFLDPRWFPKGRRISMARSETQCMAASNGKLYEIDLNSVTQVATTGILPAGVRDMAFLAGRFIYILDDDSGQFYWSALGDGTTIDGLSFATASEDDPFPLLAAWDLSDDLCLFTTETVEFWYASADPANPYQRSQGRKYNKGLLAKDSVELIDNSLFWLGHDRQIYRTAQIPQKVSSFDIDDRIRRLGDDEVKQCYASGITFGGHNFYVINLMSQGTWALDIASKTWAEWKSYNKDRFRVFVSDDTNRLFGDYFTGHMMGMDGGQYQDLDGSGGFDPIERIVSTYCPLGKGRHVNFNLILHCTRGVGGRVEMRWSDHEGHDWSTWQAVSLGEVGDRGEGAKAVWTMLGGMSPPGRLYEFRCTDDCYFAPYKVRVDEERP